MSNRQKLIGANRLDASLSIRDGASNYIVAHILQYILQFLLTIVLIATDVSSDFSTTIAYTIIIVLVNMFANAITPLGYSKVLGQNYYKDMGFKKKLSIYQILILFVIGMLTVCAFAPIANVFVNWIYSLGYKAGTSIVVNSLGQYIAFIFLLAIAPAFVEEILYRGMVARSFKSKNYIFAIFVSAAIFALMHGNPIQLVFQFFIAIVCAIVYFSTHSIYAPVIIHATGNLVSITGNYITTVNNITTIADGYLIGAEVVGILLLPIALYFFIRLSNKERWTLIKAEKDWNKKFDLMFITDKEMKIKEDKEALVKANLEKLDSQEAKEIYLNQVKDVEKKNNSTDTKALILAVFLCAAIWVLQTLMGFGVISS